MPRKTRPISRSTADAAAVESRPLELSASARQLVSEIERDWQLSPPTRALLRAAAESLTLAERFDEIAAREGYCIGDAKGSRKPHPASLLGRDHRAAFTSTMQRLLAHLQE